jgi:hypothetical protein
LANLFVDLICLFLVEQASPQELLAEGADWIAPAPQLDLVGRSPD